MLVDFPRIAVLIVLALQAPTTDKGSCSALSQTLSNGVVITVGPVAGNPPDQACEVSVRDRSGRNIFTDRGFNTKVDPATGRDIDNDGRPDAVVGVDTGGKGHCCWEFPVISFSPSPRVLLKLPPATFDFETKAGKTLIWTATTFPDWNPNASESPAVARVQELRPNGFIDVTADYCKALLAGELQGIGNLREPLAALTRQAKQDSRTETGRQDELEYTRYAAVTVILQQIYCGQVDDAARLVLEVWPATEQSRIRAQIKEAVAGRWPDLAKRLEKGDRPQFR
jgi:hypothetical protein